MGRGKKQKEGERKRESLGKIQRKQSIHFASLSATKKLFNSGRQDQKLKKGGVKKITLICTGKKKKGKKKEISNQNHAKNRKKINQKKKRGRETQKKTRVGGKKAVFFTRERLSTSGRGEPGL